MADNKEQTKYLQGLHDKAYGKDVQDESDNQNDAENNYSINDYDPKHLKTVKGRLDENMADNKEQTKYLQGLHDKAYGKDVQDESDNQNDAENNYSINDYDPKHLKTVKGRLDENMADNKEQTKYLQGLHDKAYGKDVQDESDIEND